MPTIVNDPERQAAVSKAAKSIYREAVQEMTTAYETVSALQGKPCTLCGKDCGPMQGPARQYFESSDLGGFTEYDDNFGRHIQGCFGLDEDTCLDLIQAVCENAGIDMVNEMVNQITSIIGARDRSIEMSVM